MMKIMGNSDQQGINQKQNNMAQFDIHTAVISQWRDNGSVKVSLMINN